MTPCFTTPFSALRRVPLRVAAKRPDYPVMNLTGRLRGGPVPGSNSPTADILVQNVGYTLGTEERTHQARAALDLGEVLLDTVFELLVLL